MVSNSVMLEPLDLPRMIVSHQEADQPLIIVDSSHAGPSSFFLLVSGLDGGNSTISLESQSNKYYNLINPFICHQNFNFH